MELLKVELPSRQKGEKERIKALRNLMEYLKECRKEHNLPDLDGDDLDIICEALAYRMTILILGLGTERKE